MVGENSSCKTLVSNMSTGCLISVHCSPLIKRLLGVYCSMSSLTDRDSPAVQKKLASHNRELLEKILFQRISLVSVSVGSASAIQFKCWFIEFHLFCFQWAVQTFVVEMEYQRISLELVSVESLPSAASEAFPLCQENKSRSKADLTPAFKEGF